MHTKYSLWTVINKTSIKLLEDIRTFEAFYKKLLEKHVEWLEFPEMISWANSKASSGREIFVESL